MGSNAKYLVEEDLCCPVCKKPLSSPGTPPKPKFHKIGRGRGRAPHLHNTFHAQREARMAIGKFKDQEDIVIAQCGHLFHKFCLRHYCYLVREGRSNHLYKVCCPWCDRHISMSSQTIDYRAHQDRPNDRDKDYTKTSVMNNELSGQVISVEQKLQRIAASIEDGSHNFDLYRTHWRKLRKELKSIKAKRLEIEGLYTEIERSEQMLKCMQNQQLKIVKKFIAKVREKAPKDFIHFPRRLAPFLQFIEVDDRLVRDLGEIIVPIHLNHLKSDRQSLLKGIIATVQEKLLAQGKTIEIPLSATTQSRKSPVELPPRKPAIFVKVRKSSISILSSACLTKESIQQIIETVDIPLRAPRKSGGAIMQNKKKVKIAEKVAKDQVDDDASTTDIKVLFMPKRNMLGHISHPCRAIEESESLAKVPARRCKSTDAILVKTKKKKDGQPGAQVSKLRSKSIVHEKRSNTAAGPMITIKSENTGHTTPKQNNVLPRMANTSDQGKVTVSVHEEQRKSSFGGAEELTKPASDDIIKNMPCAKNLTNEESSVEPTPEERNSSSGKDSPKQDPSETASLLKLIYDNLEEESKSTHDLERHGTHADWLDLDENNNELLQEITGTGAFSRNGSCMSSEAQGESPRPQFFRVDGRGIARPESPTSIKFRQPTFLATPASLGLSEKAFVANCFHADVENQMGALSAEEKLTILSEHEAFLVSRRNCGTTPRRPMFHGIPACLGMPGTQFQSGAPPDPQHIPFYLKKWQQQLPSRKNLKMLPRKIAQSSARSTRLMHSPRSDRTSYFNAICRRPQAITSYQRQAELELSPSGGIRLPPLSMYPAKRPSTAQHDNVSTDYQHREGPELEISKGFNYNSVWK